MALSQANQPVTARKRLLVWGGFFLALAVVGVGIWWYRNRDRSTVNEDLLRELQAASLTVAEPTSQQIGAWPQWRGPLRDGVSHETGLLTAWPEDGPPKRWSVPIGFGYSSLAVVGGRVYTLAQDEDNEVVLCLDADTGAKVWTRAYPAKFVGDYGGAPRSTPTVDEDRVYTVGATGILHCLDAKDGAVRWQKDLLKEFGAANLRWGVAFSPLVEGDLLFLNPGGTSGSSVAAVNKLDGKLAWKALDDQAGYSSPVAATLAGQRQILFFTGRGLVAVVPESGRELWRHDWKTDYEVNAATPIVVGDYVFISSGYDKGCAVLKIDQASGGAWRARPVYENNRMQNQFSSSVHYQEHLYGFNDNKLTCLDFRSGLVRWQTGGFDKGTLLAADGHLLILGENGRLALVEATPGGYREKAKYRAVSGRCWALPALAQGRLYVRGEKQLICLDLKSP
jgi:outer membrane protein assembly factor BamB